MVTKCKYRVYTKEWCGVYVYIHINRTILLCIPCKAGEEEENGENYGTLLSALRVIVIVVEHNCKTRDRERRMHIV